MIRKKDYEVKTEFDNQELVLYTANDIENIFHLGRTKAYELMRSDGFPSFRMNNRVYVERNKLSNWIEKRAGKQFNF